MKNGDTDTISDALKMFGDQDSAAKWFGHLNTKSDGSSIISDGIMEMFIKAFAAGKSGGTDAIQKMIDDTDGLKDAMSNAGLTADDLKDSIMSIADPDAKNLEGIKENLEDIFGKDGLGQSDFFKGKTDEELENFWDYLQDNNYNPKQMKWDEETTKKNFEAAQEAKKKTPEESVTFASKFKNAAEDTATDIDTVKPSSALRDIRLTESKMIVSPGFTVRKSLSNSFLPWNFVPVNTSLIICACGCAARIFLTCLSIFCFGVLILA